MHNQKDGAHDSRVQKHEQILKAVAETENIPLQTKVKSSSISWNDAKKMCFKWMRSFLSICTLVGLQYYCWRERKFRSLPPHTAGHENYFVSKCQLLVVLKAYFSKSSSNVGSEQHTVISRSLCVQGALWTVVKMKSID